MAMMALAITVLTTIANAQLPSTTYFKVTDMSSGLPDNSINDITEDKHGFIWIATWNGLARYDGKNIKTYKKSEYENSISSNMVRAVCADKYGIWVGTDGGLDYLRYQDEKFIHAKRVPDNGDKTESDVNSRVSNILSVGKNIIAQTIDGELLLLDDAKTDSDRSHIVFRTLKKPRYRKYTDITPFTDGKIMAISNEGITILSSDCEKEIYHNPIKHNFDANLNIFCDITNSKVYTGSGIGSKTTVYDVVTREGRLHPSASEINADGMMCAIKDEGITYLATDGGGLYSLGKDGKKVQYLPSNSSLPCDALYTVFADSKHNIWCGTYRHGLCMMSRELNSYTVYDMASGSLSYNIVTAIVPYGDKIIVGLDGGGIDFFDRETGRRRNINAANSNLPGDNIVSMVTDGHKLYAAIYSCGLSEMDLDGNQISTYKINTDAERGNKLWTIKDDGRGHIWVGGSSLHVFDKSNKSFSLVEGTDRAGISTIIEDGKYFWVATTYSGILKINRETRRIEQRYSKSPTSKGIYMPGDHAMYMYIDSKRKLWVNIDNKTFCSLDLENGTEFETHDARQGMTNPHVCSMIEDAKGDLWIGTDDGLYKYIRHLNAFIRKKDSRAPLTYTQDATAIIDGTAYVGTTGGILSFPLNGLSSRRTTDEMMFTSINILDSEGSEIPLYSQVNPEVYLKHGQNFFTVSFSVPEMSNPEQIQFECKLEGLEDVWRDATTTRSASYTNVPGGEYKLLVRHTNPDGSWADPSSMTINIGHAWYATTSMIMVWILLGLLVTAGVMKIRHKLIENKRNTVIAEMEKESMKKLNEAKLDFYATISHELRTPCFMISAQIEEILDSARQAVPVSSLNGIYRNSAKLNKLINHIIDFRKSNTGNLKLNTRKIELVRFLENLTYDYEQLCRQKSLSFNFVHGNQPVEITGDPDKIEQIVTNLISNAYKYTPKGGSITLEISDTDPDNVTIKVSDTGIGIVDKLQQAIFTPFYRTERGQAESTGDGLGLAFVKELVELHKGEIKLESKVNEGSTFTVVLPKLQKGQEETTTQEATTPYSQTGTRKEAKTDMVRVENPTATHSILIVDDDPDVADMVSRAFDGEYKVGYAPDGIKGVEMAKTGDYDVIITDIMMPEADGHHLITELKGNKRTSHIKIVVFSALASEDDMLKALDEGADSYLLKPTPLKVLRRHIDRLFEEKKNVTEYTAPVESGQYTREEQKFLLECRRIIDENMTDEEFGIEMLSAKLAMSHSTLYKKIRKMTGMSLIEFINDYKIYKAILMFKNGNTNVQKVSEACGFRDAKTFRDAFKKKMNIPPKQYILQLNISEE